MNKDTKRNQAMESVIASFTEKMTSPMEFSFESGGSVHPLTCTADCLVASSQRTKKAAETVLEDVRKEDNYHKEQAAARLLGLFEAHETLSSRFAEIRQSYPESAKVLVNQFPALKSLDHTGTDVWNKIKNKV